MYSLTLKNRYELHSSTLETHPPDRDCLINVLSFFNPKCEIFDKSYIGPKDFNIKAEKSIADPMNLFEGLPQKLKASLKSIRLPLA